MSNSMECLFVPLPSEVSVLIEAGLIDEAEKRINLVLKHTNDPLLRQRLELEKILLPIAVESYPYTKDEALALIRKELPEFTEHTFLKWENEGRIEYRLYDGEKHYFSRFWSTLKSVYPDVAALFPKKPDAEASKKQLLDTIASIRETGRGGCHFHLKASLRLNDDVFVPGSHVLVHLPFPKPVYPMKNIHLLSVSHEAYTLAPEDAPSRTISFERTLDTNETFFVEYEFDCEIEYHDLFAETSSDLSPAMETGEVLPHIRFTPYLRNLAASIVGSETNPLVKARLIYDFCTSEINYTFMPPYIILKDIAETCAVRRKGDCGVQALLFITLCRICGVPARFQSALYALEGAQAGCHDWAEIYLEPQGWLPVDLSFGSRAYREHDEARRRFYFGNLDPFRMVANTAFQAEFIPPKQGMRADPYDNQTGEIEVDGQGMLSEAYDTSAEVLERRLYR